MAKSSEFDVRYIQSFCRRKGFDNKDLVKHGKMAHKEKN